jgi:hypothetical protein
MPERCALGVLCCYELPITAAPLAETTANVRTTHRGMFCINCPDRARARPPASPDGCDGGSCQRTTPAAQALTV